MTFLIMKSTVSMNTILEEAQVLAHTQPSQGCWDQAVHSALQALKFSSWRWTMKEPSRNPIPAWGCWMLEAWPKPCPWLIALLTMACLSSSNHSQLMMCSAKGITTNKYVKIVMFRENWTETNQTKTKGLPCFQLSSRRSSPRPAKTLTGCLQSSHGLHPIFQQDPCSGRCFYHRRIVDWGHICPYVPVFSLLFHSDTRPFPSQFPVIKTAIYKTWQVWHFPTGLVAALASQMLVVATHSLRQMTTLCWN